MSTHKGSCLCGAVSFEVEGRFEHFFLCHCSRCRKGTGSAHAANLFGADARLTWLSGEEKVRVFSVTGTRHQRAFCTECGSAAPRFHPLGLVVPAGSLDTELHMLPDAHICVASRADWDVRLEDAPSFDHLPG